jgi:hypothetical protein
MPIAVKHPSTPKEIVEAGEKIYRERYQADYETKHLGKFVAIDVKTGKSYLGDTSSQTLQAAHADEPSSLFHLIKVGSEGAFTAVLKALSSSPASFVPPSENVSAMRNSLSDAGGLV